MGKKRCAARSAAEAAGLTRYSTGKPCRRGHVSERFVNGHSCVECKLADSSAWKERNAERVAEYARTAGAENYRRWYAANKERANAATRNWQENNAARAAANAKAWQSANPEKVAATKQRFKQNNPGIWNAYAAKRRAAELRQTPAWADHDAIEAMYALASIYRGFGFDVHVDHEVPLQGKKVCGLHVHHNLQIIPAADNRSKSNRFFLEH